MQIDQISLRRNSHPGFNCLNWIEFNLSKNSKNI